MKRKWILILAPLFLIALAGIWGVLGPTVNSSENKYFYVHTGSDLSSVKDSLVSRNIISGGFWFNLLSRAVKYDKKILPGKYDISSVSNIIGLVRKLKSGKQAPVRLTITKLRTRHDLAAKMGRVFEADSADIIRYLSSNDSLAILQLDTNSLMTAIIPNTYLYFWNNDFRGVLESLRNHQKYFWNNTRKRKADSLGLTPAQVYIMASIVEEETNNKQDKGLIASVYINRLSKGMKLEADPTVKFALGDFSIKRVLRGHLDVNSPYNTYRNTGLPPGPICTPSIYTIDAVLNAPKTDYLFFVAAPDFSGRSVFSSGYSGHLNNARAYREALDSLLGSRQNIR